MIIKQTAELKNLLKRKRELETYKEKRDDFENRRKDLSSKVEILHPLIKCRIILSAYFKFPDSLTDTTTTVVEQTELLRTNFKHTPESIIKPQEFNFKTEYLVNIQLLSNRLENELRTVWQTYTKSKLPEINTILLQALSKIPAFLPVINELNSLIRQIQGLIDILPTEQDDYDKFNQMAVEIESTWRNLVSDDVPEDVLKFLQQVGIGEGAILELLTSQVLVWLQQHNILNEFRITIRHAGATA